MDGLAALGFLAIFFLGPPFLIGLAIGWYARGKKESTSTRLALQEAHRLDTLVEQIRHDAYEHMTLDSRLAPIIVDTIRTSDLERQRLVARSGGTLPSYGHEAYGQPHGQGPYGQPPYGQSPYGRTPYGGAAPAQPGAGEPPREGPARPAPPYPPAAGPSAWEDRDR